MCSAFRARLLRRSPRYLLPVAVLTLALGGCVSSVPRKDRGEPVVVSVLNGERAATFFARLLRRGVLSEAALQKVAANEDFPSLPIIPQPGVVPGPALRRFEGLFVPGEHRLRLPIAVTSQDGASTNLAEHRVRALVQFLVERSMQRIRRVASRPPVSPAPRGVRLGIYQRLVLASLVEKEAASNRQYQGVAGVFMARLKAGSRLSSCPSIEYYLGYHRPILLNKDLRGDSPYNTYRRTGLPPTPIAFFSDGALRAALFPRSTRNYFFVFDWALGQLYFAATYSHHKRNVRRALANFRRKFPGRSLYAKSDKYYEE